MFSQCSLHPIHQRDLNLGEKLIVLSCISPSHSMASGESYIDSQPLEDYSYQSEPGSDDQPSQMDNKSYWTKVLNSESEDSKIPPISPVLTNRRLSAIRAEEVNQRCVTLDFCDHTNRYTLQKLCTRWILRLADVITGFCGRACYDSGVRYVHSYVP